MKRFDRSKVSAISKSYDLTPGGYVCRIISAMDNQRKEYLTIEYDITEGELAGYFTKLEARGGFWHSTARTIRSYKEGAQPYFEAFLQAVEGSNEGYKFDFEEGTLINKKMGVVLALEEYVAKNTGELKERLYISEFTTVDKIRAGDFTVPEIKRYKPAKGESAMANNPYDNPISPTPGDDDLPF